MLLLKRLKKQELFSSIHGESDIVQHQLELKDNFLHDKENFSILLATKANDHGNESSNIKMDGKQLKVVQIKCELKFLIVLCRLSSSTFFSN